MKNIRKSVLICPVLFATLIGLGACSDDDPPFSIDDGAMSNDAGQSSDATIDPFFQQYLGSWQSPCLFDPDRLTGPTTGDYVVYELSFTATLTTWAYQDYLDQECVEPWTHGDGSVSMSFVFSTRMVSESGLDVAVFPRDAGITIVEAITGDSTPNDDSSSDSSVSTLSSSVPVLDIVHLSSSGELFLGDLSSAPDNGTAPTRLDLNNAWTYSSDTRAPDDQISTRIE